MAAAPKFKRAPAAERKKALMAATLTLIADRGIAAATVRAIAQEANVTQGLIRHYFSSKEDLISDAYAFHMMQLTEQTGQSTEQGLSSSRSRLTAFVKASLSPPVADPRSVSLWAGFLTLVRNDARMKAIHEATYREFRDRLQTLIGDALQEQGITPLPRELRRLAIACNALLDGLWMEGGALPDAFDPEELPRIGVQSVGAIIGLDLETEGEWS